MAKNADKTPTGRQKKQQNRKGQTMSTYLDNELAEDVRSFMKTRDQSLNDTLKRAIERGLPIIKAEFPPIKEV